ncbi:MAG: bifunctional 5,10-methylenetetrahydrofolate dehydrogenase/5,10-methenyltetrahydrofolate cyclohydrolase [Coriobacteriales bacterium]|jgi:methylenetetrahydrofolate dehydrogenase (NADP+)/methenyltetrahydrofolate cyclohydrolase|nr:bifunctional 5,10-methylenetetrahydrofolate dehydrogenase/5,10-methenyltetrahydrofolate cyclohydrolase [Coriobacteriales bacterium]
MASILRGTDVADALNARVAAEVEALKAQGVTPTLAILRVGERGQDISYERGATKRAEKVGVAVQNLVVPEEVTQDVLLAAVDQLNADARIHGVLMFRPLPGHIDEDVVRNRLLPEKDIDGITDASAVGVFTGAGAGADGRQSANRSSGFAPCTPQACMEILEHFGIEVKGRQAVVVGRSLVVGKPVAMMLLDRHATVTICHSRTKNLPDLVSRAEIVIACVGRAKMVTAAYLSPGQVVVDVGINVTEQGNLVGDVDFEAASGIVDAITPVPGGVGTVTTSVLMKHVVEAAQAAQAASLAPAAHPAPAASSVQAANPANAASPASPAQAAGSVL